MSFEKQKQDGGGGEVCQTYQLSRDTEVIRQIQSIPRKLGYMCYMSWFIKIIPCLNEVNSKQT